VGAKTSKNPAFAGGPGGAGSSGLRDNPWENSQGCIERSSKGGQNMEAEGNQWERESKKMSSRADRPPCLKKDHKNQSCVPLKTKVLGSQQGLYREMQSTKKAPGTGPFYTKQATCREKKGWGKSGRHPLRGGAHRERKNRVTKKTRRGKGKWGWGESGGG